MAKKITSANEPDSSYFLKIVLYAVLGMIWLQFNGKTVFPVGCLVAFALAQHERFQIDRKVEYAVIFIAALIAAATSKGFFLNLTGVNF